MKKYYPMLDVAQMAKYLGNFENLHTMRQMVLRMVNKAVNLDKQVRFRIDFEKQESERS